MTSSRPPFACLVIAVLAALSLRARADAGPAGLYVARPARIEATVAEWGPDCGVRPQSYTTSEQPGVEVRVQGAHLALIYPDRTLRTNGCWSPNPTVKLASTSAADNRWRTECRTPAADVRKEEGRYTVTAVAPGVLELLEESDYDWRLNESHCQAKVRITQRLERGAKAGARAPAEPACVAGQVVRLRLRPSEARLEPGGRVCFQARGFDREGCALDVPGDALRWTLAGPPAARGTLAGHCFRAADAAAEAEGAFRISATGEGLAAEAVVTVAAPDLSDITARRASATTPAQAPSAPVFGGGLAGAGVKAVGVESKGPWGLVALAAAVLALVAGALVALRLRRAPAVVVPRDSLPPARPEVVVEPIDEGPEEPEPARAPEQLRTEPVEALICPVCRRGYAPGTTRCAQDGAELVAYSEYAKRARAGDSSAKQCPSCGTALAPSAAFCGVCGKRLGA